MIDSEKIFNNSDLDMMLYPVHHFTDGRDMSKLLKGMDDLPSFVNFKSSSELSKNMVIKYVVFCYDRHSPIYKKFKNDDVKRKTTAASYAGFIPDPETGLFDPKVNAFIMGFNRDVNLMIIDYIRQYNDPEYSLLVVGHESLYQKLSMLMATTSAAPRSTGVLNVDEMTDEQRAERQEELNQEMKWFLQNEKLKGDLFKQTKEISADLERMAEKILTDTNKLLKQELYSVIDSRNRNRLNITPERRAGLA